MTTVDWGTKVINVFKSDMTLIQSTPTEIYNLDLNVFRLDLKALEAGEEGMAFLDTHSHNTEVTVAGITLARVIEIINGYTVTFEDDQYAVNLIGANSNVADVTNVNQVSVRPQNSAGLVTSQAIEFGEYGGGVTVDVTSGNTGTVYPTGTPRKPVDNLTDAVLIASFRGFNKLFIIGDITISTGDTLTGMSIIGESPTRSTITIDSAAVVTNMEIDNATITGTLDGGSSIHNCQISTLNFVNGSVIDCILLNTTTTLGGNTVAQFINCVSGVPGTDTPTIDMGGSGQDLSIRNYDGGMELINHDDIPTGNTSIDFNSGQLIIDSSIQGGNFTVRGSATLTDNSTNNASINTSGLIFPDQLQLSAFEGHVFCDTVAGTVGTKFPQGTNQYPVSTLADAQTIMTARGIDELLLNGTLVVGATESINSISIIGSVSPATAVVVLTEGAKTEGSTFERVTLTGVADGYFITRGSAVFNLSNVGHDTFGSTFVETQLLDVTPVAVSLKNGLATPKRVAFFGCTSASHTNDGVIIDFNNSGSELEMFNWRGAVEFDNWTQGQNGSIDASTGYYTANTTCNNGVVYARGIGTFANNSVDLFRVEDNALINNDTIADAIWDEVLANHLTIGSTGAALNDVSGGSSPTTIANAVWANVAVGVEGTMGEKMVLIEKVLRNKTVTDPSTGIMTIYENDNTTPFYTANIYETASESVPYVGNAVNWRGRLT